jgi:hypothetical protein
VETGQNYQDALGRFASLQKAIDPKTALTNPATHNLASFVCDLRCNELAPQVDCTKTDGRMKHENYRPVGA